MTKKATYGILLIAILAVAGLYFYNKYNVAPQIEISKLEIIDQDTVRFDFNTLKGKKVIVSFYASWCPNCIEELKLLNKVKPNKLANVEVVAVTDESLTELSTFKDQKGYPFTFLKLNNAFGNIGIASIPTTYLLNTKGEIVYNKVGYIDWEDESTINHLLSIME